MADTVKMKFSEDKYVDDTLAFPKDTVVDVPRASVDRWIIRGGIRVEEEVAVDETSVEEAADRAKKKSQKSK